MKKNKIPFLVLLITILLGGIRPSYANNPSSRKENITIKITNIIVPIERSNPSQNVYATLYRECRENQKLNINI